ncbi:hypothetical protein [Dactylosporangium sp. NPDC051484]|uniref:hypothetical protein n=1 Tax=Dactylosporangium sp. NPDC051484 TaxID=3154942 RepID=UPI00344FCF8D
MGIADWIRIARGNLTPEELAEREDAARARRLRVAAKTEAERRDIRASNQAHARLKAAAAIGSVTLVCHADTLSFLGTRLYGKEGWPDHHELARRTQERPDNMRHVRLSGQQVVTILNLTARLAGIWKYPFYVHDTERAIGSRIYEIVGTVVDTVNPDAPAGNPVPPIIVDDRAAPTADELPE